MGKFCCDSKFSNTGLNKYVPSMVPPASWSPKQVKTAIWGHVAFFIGTLNLGRVESKTLEYKWNPNYRQG